MSGHEKQRQSQTTVTTTGESSRSAERQQDLGVLTPQEEKVLRMLHGLTEEDHHELKFALGADDETRARLAMMEHYLIELFKGGPDEGLMDAIRDLQAALPTTSNT